jgi:hypothetical protein
MKRCVDFFPPIIKISFYLCVVPYVLSRVKLVNSRVILVL